MIPLAIRNPLQSALSLHAMNKCGHVGSSGWHSQYSANWTRGGLSPTLRLVNITVCIMVGCITCIGPNVSHRITC